MFIVNSDRLFSSSPECSFSLNYPQCSILVSRMPPLVRKDTSEKEGNWTMALIPGFAQSPVAKALSLQH